VRRRTLECSQQSGSRALSTSSRYHMNHHTYFTPSAQTSLHHREKRRYFVPMSPSKLATPDNDSVKKVFSSRKPATPTEALLGKEVGPSQSRAPNSGELAARYIRVIFRPAISRGSIAKLDPKAFLIVRRGPLSLVGTDR
jgi:hypothetical protein